MTILIPLDGDGGECSSTPQWIEDAKDVDEQVRRVIRAILAAKRIVVVCGMSKGFSLVAALVVAM